MAKTPKISSTGHLLMHNGHLVTSCGCVPHCCNNCKVSGVDHTPLTVLLTIDIEEVTGCIPAGSLGFLKWSSQGAFKDAHCLTQANNQYGLHLGPCAWIKVVTQEMIQSNASDCSSVVATYPTWLIVATPNGLPATNWTIVVADCTIMSGAITAVNTLGFQLLRTSDCTAVVGCKAFFSGTFNVTFFVLVDTMFTSHGTYTGLGDAC